MTEESKAPVEESSHEPSGSPSIVGIPTVLVPIGIWLQGLIDVLPYKGITVAILTALLLLVFILLYLYVSTMNQAKSRKWAVRSTLLAVLFVLLFGYFLTSRTTYLPNEKHPTPIGTVYSPKIQPTRAKYPNENDDFLLRSTAYVVSDVWTEASIRRSSRYIMISACLASVSCQLAFFSFSTYWKRTRKPKNPDRPLPWPFNHFLGPKK